MALNNTFYFWHAPTHRLDMCEFTSDCCEDLALALTTCNTLKSLNLDWKPLDHSGLEVLCDALNHKNCNLKMLGYVHTVSHGQEWLQNKLFCVNFHKLCPTEAGLRRSLVRAHCCTVGHLMLSLISIHSWVLFFGGDYAKYHQSCFLKSKTKLKTKILVLFLKVAIHL